MTAPAYLHLMCGTVVPHAAGTPVFNYYDHKPGVIEQPATYRERGTMDVHELDGGAWWVRVRHDDGSTALLDQSRLCSIAFAHERGWVSYEVPS